jgi:glycosyltransferase involved in cell wall biosynthesis
MKPRALMVISLFYPCMGGAEQQALHIAAALSRQGLPVTVLTRRLKGLPAFEQIQGVPVYRSIWTIDWEKLFGITYILSVFWFLYRKRHTYDIIHCHIAQGFHSLVAMLFKSVFKKRVIIKVAATGPLSDFSMIKKVIFGDKFLAAMKKTDRLIITSAQSMQEALEEGFSSEAVLQIPNGVDTHYFRPNGSQGEENTITFIGRLDRMKGIHILIQAFTQLREKGWDMHLDIIGDGPEKNTLKQLAVNSRLHEHISFYGEVENVAPYLQRSTLFVLPSLSEGLSNVLLEAMACGLPVIAARTGGNPDIIQNGVNGLLVDLENPEQLSKAVERLLSDRSFADRLGVQARKTIEERYSMDQVVEHYQTLYSDLVPSSLQLQQN